MFEVLAPIGSISLILEMSHIEGVPLKWTL